jgi:hypothetical protein
LLNLNGLIGELTPSLGRLAGKLAVAFAVRRWGSGGGLFGTPSVSPTQGESWGPGQYLTAVLAMHFGAKLFGRFVAPAEFRRGAADLITSKLVWTEGISRMPMMQQAFGGPVRLDDGGQVWVDQGGQWDAMQGLVEGSALDGLVEGSALDGGWLPPGTDSQFALRAAYQGSGYASPFQAAYTR